ncbi:MAG: hypothetical protein MUC65_03455 [Pontiellaceae bacterium]|jgi:tetratricopeptide (TPR) repeat protein|nr:hypothetical protein [Pontiellaceae bacterium]
MRTIFSIFAVCCIFTAAGAQSVSALDRGIGLFLKGYQEWNAEKMESALPWIAQADPDNTTRYWQSVVQFHVVLCRDEKDAPETVRFLEEALDQNPQDAELSIMLAVLYGRQIAARPVRGLWLGRRVNALRDRALAGGPDNPRVQTLAGVCWLKAPEPHGSRTLAQEHLARAAELYAIEESAECDSRRPCWGAWLCYGHLGDLAVERGDLPEARRWYEAALRRNPLYGPAQKGLQKLVF